MTYTPRLQSSKYEENREKALEQGQAFLRELKELLEKYDATIDLESDYEDDRCRALVSLNNAAFYSADISVQSNEITKDTDFVVDDFKIGEK